MLRPVRLLFLLLCIAPAPEVVALSLELAPLAGIRIGGSFDLDDPAYDEAKVEEGPAYGFTLGFEFDETYHLEFMWSRQDTELTGEGGSPETEPSSIGINIDQYHINALYHWGSVDDWIRPFVLFGLGCTYYDPEQDVDGTLQFSFGLGGGVKLYLGKHLGLRLQGRWSPTYFSEYTAIACSIPGSCLIATGGEFVHQVEFTAALILRY